MHDACEEIPERAGGGKSEDTQAQTKRSTTVHFTPLKRFMAPTPMMEVEMTRVVESGMP